MNILKRARELAAANIDLFATPSLSTFLYNSWTREDFANRPEVLQAFTQLDDFDILSCVKVWTTHEDRVLRLLCSNLVNRNLFGVKLQNSPFDPSRIADLRSKVKAAWGLNDEEVAYFVFEDQITNQAYQAESDRIMILYKDGTLVDVADAADLFDISKLSLAVKKHFLCSPKLV